MSASKKPSEISDKAVIKAVLSGGLPERFLNFLNNQISPKKSLVKNNNNAAPEAKIIIREKRSKKAVKQHRNEVGENQ